MQQARKLGVEIREYSEFIEQLKTQSL